MVPVFETDLKDRGIPSVDWEHYELWEKIEQKRRNTKRLWVLGTLFVSLCLLAVPTIIENRAKWGARVLSRQLALRISRLKTEASTRRIAQRIVFSPDGSLSFRVDTVERCDAPQPASGYPESLGAPSSEAFRLIRPEQGESLGIPGLITSFCYDPVEDRASEAQDDAVLGFGFASVKDLSESRSDRVSVVVLKGKSAEISFN